MKSTKIHTLIVVLELLAIPAVIGLSWFWSRPPKSGAERMADFGAVLVSFDANGGTCPDNCRVVKKGGTYGETMNLYPSENGDYFRPQGYMKVSRSSQLIKMDSRGLNVKPAYLCAFATNCVPVIAAGSRWTYVVDIESLEGTYDRWSVGDTNPKADRVQLSRGTVPLGLKSGDKCFLTLEGQRSPNGNLTDRATIFLKDGQPFTVRYHVSLFAGTAIDAANYHWVAPGETLSCPLPVPERKGFAFDGWYEGDNRIAAESPVVRETAHTLKAHWSKR